MLSRGFKSKPSPREKVRRTVQGWQPCYMPRGSKKPQVPAGWGHGKAYKGRVGWGREGKAASAVF